MQPFVSCQKPGLIDLNKSFDLNQAIKKYKVNNHVVLELCVMSMTYLISILIGLYSISVKGKRVLTMTEVNFINHSNCEVTDSVSTNRKNDVWTESQTFADSEVRTVGIPQV